MALDGGDHRVGERGVVGDEDRLRGFVMLRLGKQIGGDPVGIGGAVGEHQHFGRARDHVDADLAEDAALGRSHPGVAGADDLDDGRNGLGAISERRHRLRAADAVDLVDAGTLRRRQHQRLDMAAGRRNHHDDALHARDLRRHDIHQHGRRIGRGAARHIEPDGVERRPAPAELDARRVAKAQILRPLALVEGGDALQRKIERGELFGRTFRLGGGDLLARRRRCQSRRGRCGRSASNSR